MRGGGSAICISPPPPSALGQPTHHHHREADLSGLQRITRYSGLPGEREEGGKLGFLPPSLSPRSNGRNEVMILPQVHLRNILSVCRLLFSTYQLSCKKVSPVKLSGSAFPPILPLSQHRFCLWIDCILSERRVSHPFPYSLCTFFSNEEKLGCGLPNPLNCSHPIDR